MPIATLVTSLLSAALGASSACALTKASQVLPAGEQSYSGKSDAEYAHARRGRGWMRAGNSMLGAAFVFAAVSAVMSYKH